MRRIKFMIKVLVKKYGLIILITIFALFIRVYRIDSIPPSLSWDEVSIGWNAYSILRTGRDEHQKFFPLDTFAAYGDYKPPIPVYLTVPMVKLFGLNEQAVRLPSAITGAITVFLTYFLVLELIAVKSLNQKRKDHLLYLYLPSVSSILLAISPWHMQLSRAGFEANIAVLFIVLGTYLILRSYKYPNFWLWCWLPYVAAIYTFNSARYFVPILSLILVWYHFEYIRLNIKKFVIGIIIAIIFCIPILPHLLSKESRLRYEEVNIFNDYPLILENNNRIALDNFSIFGKVFHNRRIVYARSYLTHYFDNLQPWFLFIRGDGNPKFSTQDTGQLYLIEAPFLIYGICQLLVHQKRSAMLLLLWLFGSIVPAAVAKETPHALRIENSLPVWQIFIGAGVIGLLEKFTNSKNKIIAGGIIIILYLFSFGYLEHNYFNHYSKEFSGEWQYGYKDAILYTESVKNNYDQIILSDIIGRPYMYTLFYGKYDPKYFWHSAQSSFDAAGFFNVKGFGKYKYISSLGPENYPGKSLFVLPPAQVPQTAHILKTINLLNGYPALVIFD
jgi:hypothetical protein